MRSNPAIRFAVAASLGLLVGLGLFYLMHTLIARGGGGPREDQLVRGVELVQVRKDSATQKGRKLPEKRTFSAPPRTPKMSSSTPQPASMGGLSFAPVELPSATNRSGMRGKPLRAATPTDASATPLVRIQPQYPRQAAEMELEGWVSLQFDIDETGAVINPKVVKASNTIFSSSALRAIKRWKYKPKRVDGKAVRQTNIRVKLEFNLDL